MTKVEDTSGWRNQSTVWYWSNISVAFMAPNSMVWGWRSEVMVRTFPTRRKMALRYMAIFSQPCFFEVPPPVVMSLVTGRMEC